MEGERTSDNCYLLKSTSPCMHEEQLEQETLAPHSEHTRRSDPTITEPSNQRHPDLIAKPDQLSNLCIEYSLPPCIKSKLSTTTKVLELLHKDLMGSRLRESIEKKRFICVDAIHSLSLP